jgi:NADPH:quinone reductase-like Zn-dependent oxidoreductase
MSKATSGNDRPGGFAEYAILEADLAIHVPAAITLEQAASFPLCSLTAAQVSHSPWRRWQCS